MAKILIAEDDPDVAELLRLRLELKGHRVTLVHDGHAALAAVRQHAPDLVVLDWRMPGPTNGTHVCAVLRDDERTRHLPVLMMSAYARSPVQVQAVLAAGADDYLIKPFSAREFARRVEALLGAPRLVPQW